jgi:hypothetical protein
MFRSPLLLAALIGMTSAMGDGSAKRRASKPSSAPAEIVTLLDPGKEPRRTLRYKPVKGETRRGAIEAGAELAVRFDGPTESAALPLPALPGSELRFEALVLDVESDGTTHLDFEITGFEFGDSKESPDLLNPKLRASLVSRIGATERWTATNRGTFRGIKLTGLPGIDAKSLSGIETLIQGSPLFLAPLPAEAIGVGARWKVETQANVLGFAMKADATYTLRSMEGDALRVDAELHAGGKPVETAAGSRPKGSNPVKGSLAIDGSAELELNLSRAMPIESRAKLEASFSRPLAGLDSTRTITARTQVAVKSS